MSNELAEAIVRLDMVLTGKSQKDCEHNLKRQSWMAENLLCFVFGKLYYLSNGNYSRIFWNGIALDGHLSLVSEFCDEVNARWKECLPLIQEVERLIRQDVVKQVESFRWDGLRPEFRQDRNIDPEKLHVDEGVIGEE